MPATGTAVKLVRRNQKSGKIEPRPRGRPSKGFDYGYTDAKDEFHPGNPPKRRGRKRGPGRPQGSKSSVGRPPRVDRGTGLSEIELIVRREVERRLKAAKAAAVSALDAALGV